MQADGWHLGLRAWNVGTPPFLNEPSLAPAEEELTNFFIELQTGSDRSPLVGSGGTLLDRLLVSCPSVIAQVGDDVIAQATASLASPVLDVVEAMVMPGLDAIGGYLRLLSRGEVARDAPLVEAAGLLADGAVAIERSMGPCKLSAAVISSWIVAAAARATGVTAIRERRSNLPALHARVTRASAGFPNEQEMLSSHIYADMRKAERRLNGAD